MNYTFSQVASFCGLRLSYYSTAALIAISFLILAPTQFRTASPLYILLTMAVLPSVVKVLFFSSTQKEKRERKRIKAQTARQIHGQVKDMFQEMQNDYKYHWSR